MSPYVLLVLWFAVSVATGLIGYKVAVRQGRDNPLAFAAICFAAGALAVFLLLRFWIAARETARRSV